MSARKLPTDPRARAAALRAKAAWHVARAGSGGSWKAAEAYEAQAEAIEATQTPAALLNQHTTALEEQARQLTELERTAFKRADREMYAEAASAIRVAAEHLRMVVGRQTAWVATNPEVSE